MRDDIKHEVVGKWIGIFQALGIDVGDGRHCACPICGGNDRFRFDNKEGNGTWICNQCGSGDGWSMLQKKLGIDFKQAIEEVKKIIGSVDATAIPKEKKIKPEQLREMFASASRITKGDFVGAYLAGRGLSVFPQSLWAAKKCYELETMKEHPAMLGVMTTEDGQAVAVHRTYLTMDGVKAEINKVKKMSPGLKKITGSAVRLFAPKDGKIGLAEGIETAIACAEMFGLPTWAATSAVFMEGFIPPKGIKEVIVFGDNDANFTGQKAAYTLANRLIISGLAATVMIPEKRGYDWLDELNDMKSKG